MAYKALYRKYRPDTFDSVVGQHHIIQTIQNAIINNKVGHAYIFSGPRGTGKTTTAKLLAKAINCTCEDHKPCNECENCRAINEGSHPDIIEIDAASNNGIDEIRELIDKVKYAPILGKYKVYIIDEVHMMTSGAFNALLKTLEEPPEHVVFILATTDVHKVLPTVLSRCQRFDFSKINYEDIKSRIVEVLDNEHITFEDKVTDLIAELADGGMRDALSILDQVVSYSGDHIKLNDIYEIYGMMSNNDMVNYLSLLANRQTRDVLAMIEEYIGKGIDVKRLTYDLMVCLKDTIVYQNTKDESILERLNKEHATTLAKYYSTSKAIKVSEILNEARSNYRLSTNYRLFFELASLKIIEELGNKKEAVIEQISEPVVQQVKKEETAIVKPVYKEEVREEIIKPVIKEEETIVVKPIVQEEKPVEVIKKAFDAPSESETINYSIDEYVNIIQQGNKKYKDDLNERFSEIRKYLDNSETRYVAQLLVDAKVGAANKDFILLIYDFKLVASRAKQKNNIILIRQFINEVFGVDSEIFVVDKPQYIDITNRYFALRQANKLAPLHEIPHLDSYKPVETQKEEVKDEVIDETVELGRDLFGDDLKVN